MKKNDHAIRILTTLLFLAVCILLTLQGCKKRFCPDEKPDLSNMVSAIYSNTQNNLMAAAQQLGHSIDKRINKIKIGADKNTFISFVLSDSFPDKFTDGDIIGFVDVSGYGEKLPDGRYGVKIYFDEENIDKDSEFINVESGKKYFFGTETQTIKDHDSVYISEFSIKKGCTWISVLIITLHGNAMIRDVCLDCPMCYE